MVDASVVVNWRILLVTSGSDRERKRGIVHWRRMARTNNILGEMMRIRMMEEKGTTTTAALLE